MILPRAALFAFLHKTSCHGHSLINPLLSSRKISSTDVKSWYNPWLDELKSKHQLRKGGPYETFHLNRSAISSHAYGGRFLIQCRKVQTQEADCNALGKTGCQLGNS